VSSDRVIMPALLFAFAAIGFVWSMESVAKVVRQWLGL
jgi:hypothetical protein